MRTQSIVLKKQNTNEYDQFVTCYTKEFGKLTAIAKSILKPSSIQAMHLDVFNLVEFELINGRAMPIIAGAQAENSYRRLKTSLPSLATAYFFTEVIDKMVPELEEDGETWDFILNLLEELDSAGTSLNFLRQKQSDLLDLLGYLPYTIGTTSTSFNGSGRTAIDDAFEYNAGFKLKSLNFLHSVVK